MVFETQRDRTPFLSKKRPSSSLIVLHLHLYSKTFSWLQSALKPARQSLKRLKFHFVAINR
jgi:hypothetical protein